MTHPAIKTWKCSLEAPVIAFSRTYICAACGEMSNNAADLCYPARWQYKHANPIRTALLTSQDKENKENKDEHGR